MEVITWVVIGVCIMHSGAFSGLNLALFGVTRLRLEVEASAGNKAAQEMLRLRMDTHFLLTTILWGNVGFNTLLAIMSNSVLAGVYAFIFSTFIITFIGEIVPQAYFSRHALKMASALAPLIRFYQIALYPVAKPTALLLDWWLGAEGIQYFREHQLREVIKKHIEADGVDIDRLEGLGALNFLALDDLPILHEGVLLDPRSVLALPERDGRLVFPEVTCTDADPFLNQVNSSGRKWVVLTNEQAEPRLLLDADGFLRSVYGREGACSPEDFCHAPIVVTDEDTKVGDVLHQLSVDAQDPGDDVVDQDTILLWTAHKRIITGADILGRLLRGIVERRESDMDW